MGEILRVGVNYDKKTKIHECAIERIQKNGPLKSKNGPLKNDRWTSKKRKGNRAKEADRNIGAKEYPYFQGGVGRATEYKCIYHKAEMKALGYEWVGHSVNGYWKKQMNPNNYAE